ncbi:MAG: hypothetical protein A3B34_01875 [Candidatus Sungbacteria bacterium RIFCSPLOWO2_01_FULL_54_21]|nr:MAG: hypothetical protein A3B34_01875 [Candidatus Sungbacteria bacterium RIFCSPLOWO2_01_FULL_54_21]
MFSQDPNALREGSATRGRLADYARVLGELHVIVRAREAGRLQVSEGLFLYPAASSGVLGFVRAWHIGAMLCTQRRFDVISVQAPDLSGCIGFFLSRRFRVPLQLQLHTDYMSPHYARAGWKERLYYILARVLVPRADCVRAVSKRICYSFQTKSGIRSRLSLESRIGVLPIFTDVARFFDAHADPETESRFASYDFKMIAAGRFVEKEKNFLMLIDMMREFVKVCPKALLVIVGEGPDKERYKLQTTNYKLEHNVIIEPWRDDLPSFLKSFDLFLLPSNYEGWGRAVIEAMAAGLPVVMTDVGLAGEVVKTQENGIIVPVGNRAAFLQAMVTLYKDKEKRKILAAAGRQTAQNLQPQTKKEYLARYRQCLEPCAFPPNAA